MASPLALWGQGFYYRRQIKSENMLSAQRMRRMTQADNMTLPQIVQRAVDSYGERCAIKEDGLEISYNELNQIRWQVAKSLHAMGIKKGDCVAVWAPNVSQWIYASLGLQSIGAVLVPINTRMKGSEAADLINRSKTRVLFTLPEFQSGPKSIIRYLDLLEDQDLPHLEHRVVMRGEADNALSWTDFLAKGDAIAQADIEAIAAGIDADDIMDMLFTSGTTGKPKGVMCAHGQNIRTISMWADTNGLND